MGCGGSVDSAPSNGGGGGDKQNNGKGGNAEDRAKDKKAAKDENADFATKMTFLEQVPLLKRLPKDQHPLVASICNIVNYKAKETIIKQGETGDEFFIIRKGDASVNVTTPDGNKKVADLKTGDYFGEKALLRDEPRSATIIAETELQTFRIKRKDFQELGLNDKLQFANRKAVGGGPGTAGKKAKQPTPKTPEDEQLIAKAIKSNENLATMTTLDDDRVKAFSDVMWKEEVSTGDAVITEGDLQADYFYVVQSGKFEISVAELEGAASKPNSAEGALTKGESKVVNVVTSGGSFGELALLYFVPRAATVMAMEDSVVWVIDRQNFKDILMQVSAGKLKEYVHFLDRVGILDPLLATEKKELAKAFVEMHFTQGEHIIEQDEAGNTFYVMYEGSVDIEKDGKVIANKVASQKLQTAEFFGEKALMENEPRGATVVVKSSSAKCLVLDRESFEMLLGPLKDIIAESSNGNKDRAAKGPAAKAGGERGTHEKVYREHLKRIGLLGVGGFGTVELWEHKQSGETYAMKGLSKGYIIKTGMQESVMNEKSILIMTNSMFITKLFETYNGTQTLYFLLEPCLGGELYATYNRKGLHGSEKHAKYYSAGVVFAFDHLHARRIIYRDLKPENLLLTEKGHIKLTDMGLAKFVIGKTFTTCGTPDYFAPELIASTGHTNAVDWWTLGVLVFELMTGHPPFESAYPMQIYAKVTKGIGKVTFPAQATAVVKNLIEQLLRAEPSERLPMRPGGSKNMKQHKWFTEFDWGSMEALTLPPPYKPVVKSKTDLANFSARKEDAPRQLEYVDPGTGWDKTFATSK